MARHRSGRAGHNALKKGAETLFVLGIAKFVMVFTLALGAAALTSAPDLHDFSALLNVGDRTWLGSDDGQIWLHTRGRAMQLVAKVTTSTRGAPGLAISGPCF